MNQETQTILTKVGNEIVAKLRLNLENVFELGKVEISKGLNVVAAELERLESERVKAAKEEKAA